MWAAYDNLTSEIPTINSNLQQKLKTTKGLLKTTYTSIKSSIKFGYNANEQWRAGNMQNQHHLLGLRLQQTNAHCWGCDTQK